MTRFRTSAKRMLLTWLLLMTSMAASAEVLQVTGSLWSPYINDQLPNGGLAADIVRTALGRAGYEIQPNVETWTRAYQGVAVGVYDVVPAIWQNEERSQDLLFSDAYLLNDIVFMARRGILIEYNTLNDLAGYRIGVVREYAYDDAFDTDPGLNRVVNSHLIQNLLLLRSGRLDVIVGDKWSILHQIAEFMPNDVEEFILLPKPLARRALRLGVSRQNADAAKIVADFDAAIREMKADGSFVEIVNRHTEGMAVLPAKR